MLKILKAVELRNLLNKIINEHGDIPVNIEYDYDGVDIVSEEVKGISVNTFVSPELYLVGSAPKEAYNEHDIIYFKRDL